MRSPIRASILPDHRRWGVRHAKLMSACGCKSHPAKAAAGEPTESCGRRGNAGSEV